MQKNNPQKSKLSIMNISIIIGIISGILTAIVCCTDIYDWIVGNNLQQITSNISINQIQNGTNNVQTLLIKNGNNKYNHLKNILFFWFLSNLIIFIFGYFVLKLYCSFTVKMTEITKRRNKVHAS